MNIKFLRYALMMLAAVTTLGIMARTAKADILVSFGGVTGPDGSGNFTWSYLVTIQPGSETNGTGDPDAPSTTVEPTFFTVYDIIGLVPGSEAQPASWSATEQALGITPTGIAPTDSATLPNITWELSSTAAQITGSATLGTFSFKSKVGGTGGPISYTQEVLKDNPGQPDDDTPIHGLGSVTGPVEGPLTLTCPSSTGQQGVPYTGSLVASGGLAPYTFSIFSGALPSPLLLNSTTGAITGTPTGAGTFSFVGKVVDSTAGTALTTTASCSIVVSPTGNGCPATKGFWHDPSQHGWPNMAVTVGGVTYEGSPLRGMVIGGQHYTQDQLDALMPTNGGAGGNGFVITGSQLIAAVLNIAAGAQHSASVDSAIQTVENLLAVDSRMVGTAYGVGLGVNSAPANNNALKNAEGALDDYNSAKGLGCSEATGLSLGSQPQS